MLCVELNKLDYFLGKPALLQLFSKLDFSSPLLTAEISQLTAVKIQNSLKD